MGSISRLLLQINTELPRGESHPVMHKLEIQTPCTKLNTTTRTSTRRAKCDDDNTPGAAEYTYISENPKAQPLSITNYTKITTILYINIEKATPTQMRRRTTAMQCLGLGIRVKVKSYELDLEL